MEKIKDVSVEYDAKTDLLYIKAQVDNEDNLDVELNEPIGSVFVMEDASGKAYAVEVLSANERHPGLKDILEIANLKDFLLPFMPKILSALNEKTVT